ncbi:unnamed protein product, partial [marine sediment metagenome]
KLIFPSKAQKQAEPNQPGLMGGSIVPVISHFSIARVPS